MLDKLKCFLIVSRVIHIVLLTVPLTIQDWISQGSGSSKWHGSLTKVTDAPSSFSHDWDDESYDDLSDYYCDKEDEEDDWPYDTDTKYSTLCDTFDYIRVGGAAFIATSSICLLMWLVVTIIMLRTFKGRPTRGCGFTMYGFSVLICILYIIGFSIWASGAQINFSGDCDDVYDEDDSFFGDQQDTCAESGTNFALATLILNIVYAPLFIYLVRKRANEMDIPYAPISHETPHPYVAGGAPNTVYQNYPNQYYNPPPQQAQYANPSAPYYPPN